MAKILVVDDDEAMAEIIRDLLDLEGFDTDYAEDGKRGYEKALEYQPDLILSDINMPVADGYDFLADIKANPLTYNIPFMFLSARSEIFELRKGMEAGADDYIFKPFRNDELVKAVKTRLQKSTKTKQIYENRVSNFKDGITKSIPHEFRTPLNGIIGFAQLLESSAEDFSAEEISQVAGEIVKSGYRLLNLTQNYTFYVSLLLIDNNFSSTITTPSFQQDLISDLAIIEAEKNNRIHDLAMDLQDTPPLKILSDHLVKLYSELINNCFKFSEYGKKVVIKAKRKDENFLIEFYNEGFGMKAEEIANIGAFTQFNRDQREQQGIGLGLAIVKEICRIYDIKIRFESIEKEYMRVSLAIKL